MSEEEQPKQEQPKPKEEFEVKVEEKPAEVNNDVDDFVSKEIEKITKEVELEDQAKAEELKKKLEESMNSHVNNKIEEFKKSYDSKFEEINKKFEEYSGRKGVVEQPKDNPYNEEKQVGGQQPVSVSHKDVVENLTKMMGTRDDYEAAQLFKQSLSKR